MRERFICLLLFLLPIGVHACDMCNCYLGLNPHYKKNTVSFRPNASYYQGTHMENAELEKHNLTRKDFKEIRNNYELMLRYYPSQKFQIQAFIPYVINKESMSDLAFQTLQYGASSSSRVSHQDPNNNVNSTNIEQNQVYSGVGDPLLLLQYQLYNNSAIDSQGFRQRLFAGMGVKFPLGKSKLIDESEPLEKSHQPGTGSWDFLPAVTYLFKYRRIGCNVNLNYLLTGNDKYGFRLANHINTNINFYREFLKGKFAFYPSLGLFYEQAGRTTFGNLVLEQTGGSLLLAHTGFDFYFKSIALNMAIQMPLEQKMNGSQPELTHRILLGINYSIN